MTCKDCVNQAACMIKRMTDEHVAAKMYNVNFWENAEKSCRDFRPRGKES